MFSNIDTCCWHVLSDRSDAQLHIYEQYSCNMSNRDYQDTPKPKFSLSSTSPSKEGQCDQIGKLDLRRLSLRFIVRMRCWLIKQGVNCTSKSRQSGGHMLLLFGLQDWGPVSQGPNACRVESHEPHSEKKFCFVLFCFVLFCFVLFFFLTKVNINLVRLGWSWTSKRQLDR